MEGAIAEGEIVANVEVMSGEVPSQRKCSSRHMGSDAHWIIAVAGNYYSFRGYQVALDLIKMNAISRVLRRRFRLERSWPEVCVLLVPIHFF